MIPQLPVPELGISEADAQRKFEELQKRLVPLWQSIRTMSDDEQTIVVVPSVNVKISAPGSLLQAFEERFLFLLLLLRQPKARLIYVTSQAIHPHIVDYYLNLLPGVSYHHARRRLFLVSPMDASPRSLTLKLLERPRLLTKLRSLIRDPQHAHLVPFNTTLQERDLALRLGIPLLGADPRLSWLGTKSGCRKIFRDENVGLPMGREDLQSENEIVAAMVDMLAEQPNLKTLMVKLNEGVSGQGNATVDVAGLGEKPSVEAVAERVHNMKFELDTMEYEQYMSRVEKGGAIVEERIVGHELQSPSVQMRVTPLGNVPVISTHDQLLAGPGGQTYMGCIFPAHQAYAAAIAQEARKVGDRLAREGVIGRFAIDFMVARQEDGSWKSYAIELNLRKGGTTHPFLTLQFLTDGHYDSEAALYRTPDGRPKFYVATDHCDSANYRALSPDDLLDIVVEHKLHFVATRQTGVVLHMLSSVGECGRFGMTAVHNSPEEAHELYHRAIEVFDAEALAAARH